MRRAHIAVITPSANGHVYPALPLCAELVNRGHRITYALSHHYARDVAEVGAEPVQYKSKPVPNALEMEIKTALPLPAEDPRARALKNSLREYIFSDSLEIVGQIQGFYRANPPDLILYDRYASEGRVLTSQCHCPAVQISSHFAFYRGLAVRENGVCTNPETLIEWARDLDLFLWNNGITTKDNYWHTESLNIHFIPKEFQHNSEYFDDRFCFLGALLNRPFYRTWQDRSAGKPIILISGLSALHEMKLDDEGYFLAFVDALSASDYHCILSIRDDRVARTLGNLPPNFEINRSSSHLEILPRASLLICHAGMGSTLEAIYNAVPTLVVPQGTLCREVAYRIEELGLGIQLPNDQLSGDTIRSVVQRIISDELLKSRVREMQHVFQKSAGAPLGADRIEALLS